MSQAKLVVVGDARSYDLQVGESILQAALRQGIGIDHACGGVCACSTCHVRIKRNAAALSPPSEDELDQLDEARAVALDSRLACQAVLTQVPADGIEIAIPAWNINSVREGS